MPVAAPFHSARDAVLAAVDKVFAEPVRLSPMENGRTDPQRPQVEIEAVLRVGGGTESNMAGGYSQSWRTQLAAGKAELHVDRATQVDLIIREGDKIRATSRHGSPLFSVLRVDDRGDTRLVLELGEL